jgi:hypothetical protein
MSGCALGLSLESLGRFLEAAGLSPFRVRIPANRFRRVFCPATRPYVPLFSKVFRKTRPFPPPQFPRALENAGFAVSG